MKLLLEYKIKKFLEDMRSSEDKLKEEFLELDKKDNLLRMCGCLVEVKHKKWIHRAKYMRKRIKFQGIWQVNWKNIAIGKK